MYMPWPLKYEDGVELLTKKPPISSLNSSSRLLIHSTEQVFSAESSDNFWIVGRSKFPRPVVIDVGAKSRSLHPTNKGRTLTLSKCHQ